MVWLFIKTFVLMYVSVKDGGVEEGAVFYPGGGFGVSPPLQWDVPASTLRWGWQEPGETFQRWPCRGETPNIWPCCMFFPKLVMSGKKIIKKKCIRVSISNRSSLWFS